MLSSHPLTLLSYENHVAANGEPSSHATRNEILAGFAGAFIDRVSSSSASGIWRLASLPGFLSPSFIHKSLTTTQEAETRGLDFIDREKAKREAQNQLQQQF